MLAAPTSSTDCRRRQPQAHRATDPTRTTWTIMLFTAALVLGQCGLPRCTTLETTGSWSGETFVPSVSPACYYGVPTNQETLDLLAGSWFFFAGGSNLWVAYQSLGNQAVPLAYAFDARQHGQSGPLAVAQLTLCAFSQRLWAARHSQGEAQPVGSQPPPRALELAASKSAFDHSGPARQWLARLHRIDHGEAGGRHVRAGTLQLPGCRALRPRWVGARVQERLRSHLLLLCTALDGHLRRDDAHAAGSRRLGGCAPDRVRASGVLVRYPILRHTGRRSPAGPGRLLGHPPGFLLGGWRLFLGVGFLH